MIKKHFKRKADKVHENYLINNTFEKITFFTGAGISKESGLSTFRDEDGLWNNHSIEEIATADALKHNFEVVNKFYNERRQEIIKASPNNAHLGIKDFENKYNVSVITQNVDDLHERAGSENIIHLHGEIMKSRPIANSKIFYPQKNDIKIGDRCIVTNSQLRPHIVLFGENLDEGLYFKAKKEIRESSIVVVIGSSLQVNPANYLVTEASFKSKLFIIDPNYIELNYIQKFYSEVVHIKEIASKGIEQLKSILLF